MSALLRALGVTDPADDGPVDLSAEGAAYLEQEAAAVDTLELGGSMASSAAAAARRIALLASMQGVGLLDAPADPTTTEVLEDGRCGRVLGYVAAAAALRDYLSGPIRAALVPAPRPQSVYDGPVSLDWYRLAAPIPDGLHPDEWLAGWEAAERGQPPVSVPWAAAAQGWESFSRDEGGPRPALVRAAPSERTPNQWSHST